MAPRTDTRERVLEAALLAFGTQGFDATSLDQLAVELGVRKQTILYYFPSKAELLDAVVDRSSQDLAGELVRAIDGAGPGFDRIEALVRAVFRLALSQPELLGLIREASRLGPHTASRLFVNLAPLVDQATGFLEAEMTAGRFRKTDAKLLLVSVYSTVLGAATEVEVLRAIGIEPSLRTAVLRRRQIIEFLRYALVPEAPAKPRTNRTRRNG